LFEGGLVMGANSTQGVALLLFLVGFTFLSLSMFSGGSIVYLLLFAVSIGASISLFLKCKPWEHMEEKR
jgi:hypothetical protein